MAVNDSPSATAGCTRVVAFRRFVGDLDRSIDFYCGALGFELERVRIHADAASRAVVEKPRARKRAVLVLGAERLELVAIDDANSHALRQAGAPANSLRFQHFAIVAADMDAAFSRLARVSPAMISTTGPIRLPPSTGSVSAVKFRDPDGHPLELIAFPVGTGDARWQRHARDAVTLGIDHSAIAVADAARSIAFYRDVLGLSVAARQVNRGPEQDRLDGLAAVEVDVVALSALASATPHLELLGYLRPRPVVDDVSTPFDDCIVWQATNLRPEPGDDPDDLLLRDPDGHAHLLRPER